MRMLLALLAVVAVGCDSSIDTRDDEALDECPKPDTYVIHAVELRGDCGALPPEIGHAGPKDAGPGCTAEREEAHCFLRVSRQCEPNDDGLAIKQDSWLDGEGGAWTGELWLTLEQDGQPFCSSVYRVQLDPR